MRIAISLFITSLLFQVNAFAQDTTIVWKKVNNSSYSFKYPEKWKVNFKDDSKDGFTIEIYEKSNRKAVATINFGGQKMWQKQSPEEIIKNELIEYKDSARVFYPMGVGESHYDSTTSSYSSVEFGVPQTDEEPLYSEHLEKYDWQGTGLGKCYCYEIRVEPGTDPRSFKGGGRITCIWFLEKRTCRLSFSGNAEIFMKYKPIVESIIQSTSVKK